MLKIPCGKSIVSFISRFDGSERRVLIDIPYKYDGSVPLPLVIAPHPSTWSAEVDYENGPETVVAPHPGWKGLADRHGFILVAPFGHGRTTGELQCLGYEGQIADMGQLLDEVQNLGCRIDYSRIYACGLSMGGQETLLFAAVNANRVAAAFAFNPVVDPTAFYEDLRSSEEPWLRMGEPNPISDEVGGTPSEIPHKYAKRSPISYAKELANVPLIHL